MPKQKNSKVVRNKLIFSWLFTPTPKYHERRLLAWGFIFSLVIVSLFFIFTGKAVESSALTGDTANCTTQYGDWSACSPDGKKTRTVTRSCSYLGAVPSTYTYTESQQCTYTPPTCVFTYSDWIPDSCPTSGTQNRTITSKTPSGCQGGTQESLVRSCTPPDTIIPCTSYHYSDWTTTCQSGYYTRQVLYGLPSGCSSSSSLSAPLEETTKACATDSSNQDTAAPANPRPEFAFLELPYGTTLRGEVVLKGKVDSAQKVEFYLSATSSNTQSYVGSAKNSSGNYWELTFDTTGKPNGSFALIAKIKNDFGPEPYEGERILVYINNLSEPIGDDAASSNIASPASSGGSASSEISQRTNLSLPENFNGETSQEWQEKYFQSRLCLDKNNCAGTADPDKDGLNNNDEFRYQTDPKNPDSDNDGFLDGDEVRNGYNPLKFSPGDRSDKVVFENPKEIGEIKKELYQVKNVEVIDSSEGKKELRLSGKGLPNSFVNIYIYSDLPVILTVKTDSEGNWSYVLDKQIEDGEHQVYVAVTDNTGKITAKSEPLFFVKTAEAVTVIPSAEASSTAATAAPAEKRRTRDLMVLAGIIILGFIVALTAIGFYIIHVNKKPEGLA